MSVIQDLSGLLKQRALRLLGLTALIVGVGTFSFVKKLSVLDPDIWWHLSVGDWILQHRSVPRNGIFSQAASRPWMAYSWGYEVLLARAYDSFSFVGMGLFGATLTIAVAIAIFIMLYRVSGRFWIAWLLSGVTCAAFLFNIAPRPVFLTVILYTITLTQIFEAQRTGRFQALYWLPLVFLLWANIHIQFIYGLAVLGLFAGTNLIARLAVSWQVYPDFLLKSRLPVIAPFVILACCIVSSCIGPYSYHLYHEAFVISQSKIMYKMIIELQALSFNFYNHYFELLLALTAFFTLGWSKKLDPFKLALLFFASAFAFRTWRDAWFLCVTASALIADFPDQAKEREPIRRSDWALVALASIVLLFLAARNTDLNSRTIDRMISNEYPVNAANFLRKNPIGGPLYNSFDWGGFLIFYMPEYPVSIDGRTDLYGDAMDEQYYETQEADPSYHSDPFLNQAGVAVLKSKYPITQALLGDRRFRVIYRDDIAVVFARNF